MPAIHHDALAAAAERALRAPSVYNTQPWVWDVDADSLQLSADRDRQLDVIDPEGRLLLLSCGIALHHVRVALRAAGYTPTVQRWVRDFSDDLLARVTVVDTAAAQPGDHVLADAIGERRTDRRPYSDEPVPPLMIEALQAAARTQGSALHVVREEQLPMLAVAVAQAEQQEQADPAYRGELMRWTNRPAWSADGVPVATAVRRVPRRIQVRQFALEPEQALMVEPGGDRGAVYLIVHRPGESAADWFAAGEAVSAVMLSATALGLAVAPMSDVIEVAHPRDLVAGLVPAGGRPFLVLRCGLLDDPVGLARTPRRAPHDVIHELAGWSF